MILMNYKWCAKWNLFFNADKCKVMHFGMNNAKYSYIMKLSDNEIMNVINCEEEKDLGVIFDCKLSFDAHVQCVISKANRNIGITRRTLSYLKGIGTSQTSKHVFGVFTYRSYRFHTHMNNRGA